MDDLKESQTIKKVDKVKEDIIGESKIESSKRDEMFTIHEGEVPLEDGEFVEAEFRF